jgi:hypothetical protein
VPGFLLANESLESSPEPELLRWSGMTPLALAPGAYLSLPNEIQPIELLAPQHFYHWATVNGYTVAEGIVREVTVNRQPEQKPTAAILLRPNHQCAGLNSEVCLSLMHS